MQPYDIKDVIHRWRMTEIFSKYTSISRRNIVVGFARLDGKPVGIVANQPAVLAGCAGYKCVGEGRAVREILRRVQYSAGHF